MKLHRPGAEIWTPDGTPPEEALARTTDMGIGAHQDDVEILGQRGILDCFDRKDRWFTAVVVTDGAGSARGGPYADYDGNSLTAMAISSIMYNTGDPDREPLTTGGEPGEYIAGVHLWIGILARAGTSRARPPPRSWRTSSPS